MRFSLILLFLLPALIKAQISINYTDMPAPNDTIRVSKTTLSANQNLNLLATGDSVFLDFSAIDPGTQDVVRYLSSIQTPYGFYFFNSFGTKSEFLNFLNNLPTGNIPGGGGFSVSNVYDFFKNSGTGFLANGRGLTINNFPAPAYFTDPDEIYLFPLEYGDRDSTTFLFDVSVPTISGGYKSSGYRINTVDGWGKIKVPTGTFDCIRVKSEIFFKDVVTIPAGVLPIPFPIPPITINYKRIETKWLAKDKKIPIVQINEQILPFGGTNQIEVIYQDINRLPIPDFKVLGETSGCKPLTVSFQNQSENYENVLWNFGDGGSTTVENPTHTYYQEGYFNVTLTASNSLGQTVAVQNNVVKIVGPDPKFEALVTNIKAPGDSVFFRNKTIEQLPGTYLYRWNFGDGTFSASENPVHIYEAAGVYDVRLIVIDPTGCKDTLDKKAYIKVSDPTGVSSVEKFGQWTVYPNPAQNALTISFQNPRAQALSMKIYDLTGRLVSESNWTNLAAGAQTLNWERPAGLTSGLYLLKLESANGSVQQKIVLE